MNEKDWLILKTLQEKRSITKTAAAVYLSQPALSKRLRQIEDRFGVPIALRNKNGIELTPAGEYLVTCADAVLEKISSAAEHISDMSDQIKGTIRVGASSFCTKYALPDLLAAFKTHCPMVEVQVTSAWSSDVTRNVSSGALHIGFTRNAAPPPDERHLLFKDRMNICSSAPLDLSRLPDEPQISYKADALVKAQQNIWWTEHYSRPPRVSMMLDRLNSSMKFVTRGLGWAFLSDITVKRLPDLYTYPVTHRNGTPYYRNAWLTWNKDAIRLKSVAAFVAFAKTFPYANYF